MSSLSLPQTPATAVKASPTNPAPLTAPLTAPSAEPASSELRQAAEQFEAIFVRRLLAQARSSPWAEQGVFTGSGLKQFETMFDENIAEVAASNGGFGLADQIERQLAAITHQKRA